MLKAVIKRNDNLASVIVGALSVIVFAAVVILHQGIVKINPGFDAHIFAKLNAAINFTVSVLLITGYILVRRRKYEAHRAVMLTSIGLSSLFLISYIAHHLLAPETKFGGTGDIRYFYYFILITHICLAGIILPFILWTSYQSLSGNFAKHKKWARYTFPVWLYVSITGVLVYIMISPYYV